MSLSIDAKDAVCPRQFIYDGFTYTRKNFNQKTVTFICRHKRRGECKAQLHFNRSRDTGEVDFDNKRTIGQHTRKCCIINGVDINVYDYEGKSRSEGSDEENVHPNQLPVSNGTESNEHVDKKIRLWDDVSEEMKDYADELATGSPNLLPAEIWEQVKAKMDENYQEGWSGVQKASIIQQVRDTRMQMNGGDPFSALENSQHIWMKGPNKRPFLQCHSAFSSVEFTGPYERIMVFGNPYNFGLLKNAKSDIYIDTALDCCPTPFSQCLIVMIFLQETKVFVPILYILMTSKTQHSYCHALMQAAVISDREMDVNSFTSEYEGAIMNSCQLIFPGSFHTVSLFHLKQAWRRHLIKELVFLSEEITLAMNIGVLDLLCVIPQEEIREFGIPFVRSIIEEGLSAADIAKWGAFWTYFEGQWMPITDSWNICTQNDRYKIGMNRANIGLGSYNKRFNGLFAKHNNPSLIEFVQILEKESRYYADKLHAIRGGKEAEPTYKEGITIPVIPNKYSDYKQNR